MNRFSIAVTGESGMGLLSVGQIVSRALKELGFYVNSDREYPSLIKGGHSKVQIDFSEYPVRSLTREVDVMIGLDRSGILSYVESIKKGGILIHGNERYQKMKGLEERIAKRKIKMIYCPARSITYQLGGTEVMVNMVLLGLLWKILGLNLSPLKKDIEKQFASKPKLLETDLKCVQAGYLFETPDIQSFGIPHPKRKLKKILLDGNMALTLGAIHAGVRAYFAYPMSPSSSILTHMANFAHESGMVVKQAEDEITAAQMAIGAMAMGARALVATSGGGFDLMTETFSLAGMIETPLVIIVAQRPGPATGLPTWTAQADLNLAMHAGHGEYPRVVMAASDPTSAFILIQQAFNLSEQFQTPVLVLTEKVIAETQTLVDPFPLKKIPIKRGLVTDPKELISLKSSDRYGFTPSGVSLRWIPGSSPAGYCANSDEHQESGALTEDAEPVARMASKRMRKFKAIEKALPEPQIYGPKNGAKISFVGWGSSKNAMLDIIDFYESKKIMVNYLHYEYLFPLKIKAVEQFFRDNKNIHLIEGNFEGQLGHLLTGETGLKFKGKLLKYDGRPFFVEDLVEYIDLNLKIRVES